MRLSERRATNIGLLYPKVRNNIGGDIPVDVPPNQNIGGDVSPASPAGLTPVRITDAGGREFRFRGDLYSQESTFLLVCYVMCVLSRERKSVTGSVNKLKATYRCERGAVGGQDGGQDAAELPPRRP